MNTRRRDLRLVPTALGVWATALVCVYIPDPAWGIAAGSAAVAVVAVLFRRGLLCMVLLAVAAVAVTAALAQHQRAAAADLDGRSVEVVGTVSSSSSVGSDGRLWFDLHSGAAGAPGAPTALDVPMRVGVDPAPGLDLGAQIRVVGQAMATDAGERATLVVFGTRVEVVQPASGVFGIAAQTREDFIVRATALPEPGAGLLPGLAVGDTRAVSDELNAAMLASGLSHLTAVSGANCAIVVGAVFWVVALCGGGRRLRVVISLTALGAFVVLVTPEPSVIRAAVMAGLAMTTLLCGRPGAGAGVLCLAAVGILIADPWLAATPGFALSAAATAALIVLAPPLSRGLARWMPQPLALAVGIPLSAQLACGPIIALFAEQQSLIGIPANMLADPAAPVATVIGLLACLAAPVPLLADLFAAAAWLPAAWIATTATVSTAVPGGILFVVPGLVSAVIVAVLSTAVGVLVCRDGPAGMRTMRRASAAICIIAVAVLSGRMLLAGPLAVMTMPDDWAIAACDVGQGDALVVRSEGRVALIDTGIDDALLDECLRSLAIDRIDLLVLTHFDADHVGAVGSLIGRVGTVLHGPVGEDGDQRIIDAFAADGAHVVEASEGMGGSLGGASWDVLWPRNDSAAFAPGNDTSLVLSFEGGGVPRSLFLGDLSATPQRMLSSQLHGAYPVVKVSHHGSADQDPGLYERVHPVVAIFSAGAENDYGHPRAETLALLEAAGAVQLRTDTQGRILIGLDGDALVVRTERTAGVDDPG